jgi:hypothetical protein
MEWSTGNSYQAEALGYNKTIYLCFHPLPIPMVARITKYLNKYVRRGICLKGGKNIGKSSYYNLPPDIGFILFKINSKYDHNKKHDKQCFHP